MTKTMPEQQNVRVATWIEHDGDSAWLYRLDILKGKWSATETVLENGEQFQGETLDHKEAEFYAKRIKPHFQDGSAVFEE